jgi:hypothetical protein
MNYLEKRKIMYNIEEYKNIIEFLNQALKFYANTDNYNVNRKISDEIFSAIQMDSGSQARFALKRIKIFNDAKEKTENDYNALIESAENLSEEEQLKLIKELIALK